MNLLKALDSQHTVVAKLPGPFLFMQNRFDILTEDQFPTEQDNPSKDHRVLHSVECHAYGNAKLALHRLDTNRDHVRRHS